MTTLPSDSANLLTRRQKLSVAADYFVLGAAVTLPWSTGATSALLALWALSLIFSNKASKISDELRTAAGLFPVALWLLAGFGLLWAEDVTWSDRLRGGTEFNRLLAIPLLLAQFRNNPSAAYTIVFAFFGSCLALLLLSFLFYAWPSLSWRWSRSLGVPVRDYIAQSGEFALCSFGLLAFALKSFRSQRPWRALAALAIALLFVSNVMFIATGRTTVVVMIVLLVWFGIQQVSWKSAGTVVLCGTIVLVTAWVSSPYLQARLTTLWEEVHSYDPSSHTVASAAIRLEFWKRSSEFVRQAPILGHGTGSVESLFRKSASGTNQLSSITTRNPHNQILIVVIQLGLIGGVLLISMWGAHLQLFLHRELYALFGSFVVIQNIIGSLFNSHLFDFSQGWLYVLGVGVLGSICSDRAERSAA